jgi:hypothetical protein
MLIVYLTRMGGADADVSYNAAWMGLWAFAEISLGIVVTCMLSLPRLIEAKGQWVRDALSCMSKPFTFFSKRSRSRSLKKSTAGGGLPGVSASTRPSRFGAVAVPKVTRGQTLSETELDF